MKIEIKKLKHLINKYHDEFNCLYYSNVVAAGKKFKAGTEISLYDLNRLADAGITELEIRYDVTLYEYLSREYPVEYRRPVRWIDYYTLDHYLEELHEANTKSRRKRFLYVVGDIYRSDGKSVQNEIVFRHGDRIDFQKWKINKIYIDSGQKFFLRNSESGIIIFGTIKSEEPDNQTDYRKKLDLIGSMVSHKFDKKFEISPDFIPNKDVYKVALPGKLAEEYINTNVKLIIIGETLTHAFKDALLQVMRYDPFVRMIVTPPLTPQNIDHVLLQIKMVYNTERWRKR
ncbi:MAG: hypothetical protein A2176_06955 [Spirochaetes bacterium RBG_13_51_14]|nr:MAG: hypothetical protein A2176_06955 [Spirochaetes bacterium RBG_13_51_14]